MKPKRLPYLFFHMRHLNDLQPRKKPERKFWKLYLTAVVVIGCSFGWCASQERAHRKEVEVMHRSHERSIPVNSAQPRVHLRPHVEPGAIIHSTDPLTLTF